MKNLILLVALVIPVVALPIVRPARIVADFEQALEDDGDFRGQINKSIDALVEYSALTLKKQGYFFEGNRIQMQWEYDYNRDVFIEAARGIPDHPPMWVWLDNVMQTVISKLGRPFCIQSHICDLYSFNQTLPIAINVIGKKCNFPMQNVSGPMKDEHRRCMVTDGVFDGLYSITVYWLTNGACMAASGNIICGFLAMLAEDICEKYICGPLADRIYTNRCGQ